MTRFFLPFLAVLVLPLVAASATDLAPTLSANAIGGFWEGFRNYWTRLFGSASGAVLVAVSLGALGLFIITRGKWIK